MIVAPVLAVLAAFVSSALAAPAGCGAARFQSGMYGPSNQVSVAVTIPAKPGQTVTGTIVDLATCAPFSGSPAIVTVKGGVLDADTDWSDPESAMSGTTVNNANTVSFVAEVPNGSQHLTTDISAAFTGGTLANFNYVFQNVGVMYTLE
ncbi:hypothetical protein EXIGLDRAFT_717186 [Exidia glandulosa HHB12029]|uniref:Uncharacterized protein n=1 Tax=Exidia glandulosa HHB12029 TaxID=1314781 RepID=A0A165P403_EXIGL|nr:hypothetical protein EXIGLDRAFT_717186 [Exidia glandulosa HHB12029]